MTTYIALLRAVNVGGKNRIAMPALRSSLSALGLEDVATYVQSGNVVFRATSGKRDALRAGIEQRIEEDLGIDVTVLLRTARELVSIADRNPFLTGKRETSKLHVVFLSDRPSKKAVAQLDPERSPGDELGVAGQEIFLHLPNGAGRSKLTVDYFERRLDVQATARNWNTVTKLRAMSST